MKNINNIPVIPINNNVLSGSVVQALKQLAMETGDVLTSMKKISSADVIEREMQAMLNQSYRVAIIGEFKSGKSTLINAAMLGREVLFTDPMEATCVATEINYDEKATMAIFPYEKKTESLPNSNSNIVIRGKEAHPVVVANPTPKDIRMETTADTPEGREFKARRISKVSVGLPIAKLKDLTVIDSPGINSTNQAVADVALRIIPSCDAVVFVTRGGQLSKAEEDFLSSGVFSQGITRALVVINHFDNLTPLNSEGRRYNVEVLRSKLSQFGKGHLEIAMVDAGSWLNALKAGESAPDDAMAFSQSFSDFLHRELGAARLEKLAQVCRREIRSTLVELSTIRTLNDKQEKELEEYSSRLKALDKDASLQIDNLIDEFEDELSDSLRQFRSSLRGEVNNAVNQFKVSLNAAPDLSEMSKVLSSMQQMIQPKLEVSFFDSVRRLKQELVFKQSEFDGELRKIINRLDEDMLQNPAKGLAMPSIPAPVVTIVDYILVIVLSPLPMVADVLLRLLADRFPEIQKIMPSGLAKSYAYKWIVEKLDQQTSVALDEIDQQIDQIRVQALAVVAKSTRELLAKETKPIHKAIAAIKANKTPWSPEEITLLHGRLDALEAELSQYVS